MPTLTEINTNRKLPFFNRINFSLSIMAAAAAFTVSTLVFTTPILLTAAFTAAAFLGGLTLIGVGIQFGRFIQSLRKEKTNELQTQSSDKPNQLISIASPVQQPLTLESLIERVKQEAEPFMIKFKKSQQPTVLKKLVDEVLRILVLRTLASKSTPRLLKESTSKLSAEQLKIVTKEATQIPLPAISEKLDVTEAPATKKALLAEASLTAVAVTEVQKSTAAPQLSVITPTSKQTAPQQTTYDSTAIQALLKSSDKREALNFAKILVSPQGTKLLPAIPEQIAYAKALINYEGNKGGRNQSIYRLAFKQASNALDQATSTTTPGRQSLLAKQKASRAHKATSAPAP